MECAEIKVDDKKNRYLEAKRDIKQGEVILTEDAVMVGPSGPWTVQPLCISCYKLVFGDVFICNGCKWPFCNENCSKAPQHAKFECRIFKNGEVKPSKEPQDYYNITVLRSCLLKEANAKKFDALMKLAPLPAGGKPKKLIPPAPVTDFICKKCKKKEFDNEMIAKLCQIVTQYAFSTSDRLTPQSIPRYAALLFPTASLMSHDCAPNTSYIRIENPDNSFGIKVWAAVDIPKGEKITNPYLDITRPHMERRFHLTETINQICTCKRCNDPTEFGTYYGAVKCQKCKKNYMISTDLSKGSDADWKCLGCGNVQRYRECTVPIETEVFEEIEKCLEEEEFEKVLEKYCDVHLHPNHWLMMDCRQQILKRMYNTIACIKPKEDMVKRAHVMLEYCKQVKVIIDAFHPGWNRVNARQTLYTEYAEALIKGEGPEVDAEIDRIEDIIRRGDEMSIYPSFDGSI